MRACKRCRLRKPIKEFPSNPAYKDGKGLTCSVCKVIELYEWKRICASKALESKTA